jgi:O-antigen/teichoic acid export membrane protein
LSKEPSLAKNTAYSAMASGSNVLLVALVIIGARILGDSRFGEFSFALALATIFEMLIDLGITTLTARDVARDRTLAPRYLPNILGWKLVLSAVAMALLVLTVNLLHQSRETMIATYIMGLAAVLRSFKYTTTGFFQAFERFDLITLTIYIERIGILVSGIAALLVTRSLIAFSLVFVLWRIPDLLIAFRLLHKQITHVRIGFDWAVVKRIQMAAIPFGSYAVVAAAYAYISIVILSAMRSAQHVGWYSASSKIYEGMASFPFLVAAVLLPRLSRLYVEDQDRHRALSLRALRYMALSGLPLAVCVGIFAPQALVLVYGKEYLPAVPALRILLAACVPMFLNATMNTVLISGNREKSVLRVACAGLVVMTASNLVLVHRIGVSGAAWSFVVSESCVFVLLLITVRRTLRAFDHREWTASHPLTSRARRSP